MLNRLIDPAVRLESAAWHPIVRWVAWLPLVAASIHSALRGLGGPA